MTGIIAVVIKEVVITKFLYLTILFPLLTKKLIYLILVISNFLKYKSLHTFY